MDPLDPESRRPRGKDIYHNRSSVFSSLVRQRLLPGLRPQRKVSENDDMPALRGNVVALQGGGDSTENAKNRYAGELDLSQFTAAERQKMCGVLQQVEAAEKKAANHSRSLQESHVTMLRKLGLSSPGKCPLCHRSLEGITVRSCWMCSEKTCHHCIHLLQQPSPTSPGCEQSVCRLCFLKRQVLLTSSEWREDEANAKESSNDLRSIPGYGMVLVCGLKTDGGVLRSFVVEAPVGGSAFQSGVLEGDEVVSWCDERLIGLDHSQVCGIVQRNCQGSVFVDVRQYSNHGVMEQKVCWMKPQAMDSISPSQLVQRILIDPVAIGFPAGIFQTTRNGQVPLYPHGRIKLAMTHTNGSLTVSVEGADNLPSPRSGMLPSPSASVSLNGKHSTSTSECRWTQRPKWNEKITFKTSAKMADSVLKVSVKTPKQLFGKAALGEYEIQLGEARFGQDSEWYRLQAPADAHHPYLSPCPTSELNRQMLTAHRLLSLGPNESDLDYARVAAGKTPIWYPERRDRSSSTSPGGSAPRSPARNVRQHRYSVQEYQNDPEISRRKTSAPPLGSIATSVRSPLVPLPTVVRPQSAPNGSTSSPLTFRREQSIAENDEDVFSSNTPPQPHPSVAGGVSAKTPETKTANRRAEKMRRMFSVDGPQSSDSEAPSSPRGKKKMKKTASQRKIEAVKNKKLSTESQTPKQKKEARPSLQQTLSEPKPDIDSSSDKVRARSPKYRRSIEDGNETDSPWDCDLASSGCESTPTLPRRGKKQRFSQFENPGEMLSVFSRDSDSISILSSLSDLSDTGSLYLGLDLNEDDLRDTRVELTFTAASRTLSVGVVKVENVSCVAQHENVKLGQMSGVGVKLSLLCVGGNRQKHKTRPQRVGNCIEFNQQFSFHTTSTLSSYTLKAQVIAKMQRSMLRTRSQTLAFRLFPLQDLLLQEDRCHRETFKVYAKSRKPSQQSGSDEPR